MRRAFLRMQGRTFDRLTVRLAKAGRGPFTIVRHVGRKSGRVYETPVIVARIGRDFVVELTWGADVQWYRNVVAAGGCELVRGSRTATIVAVEPIDAATGLAAYGGAKEALLRLLKRQEFRRFVVAP